MPQDRTQVIRAPADVSPKVLNPSIVAAVATVASALDGDVVDPTTLVLAIVTVAVFVIGYFTKDKIQV